MLGRFQIRWKTTFVLSGFTGLIAGCSGCQRNALHRLLQEMLSDWDHPLLFREQGEVAGGRDHGELGLGDELDGLNRVLQADKIVISEKNEHRRLDGSQLLVRKSFPLNFRTILESAKIRQRAAVEMHLRF